MADRTLDNPTAGLTLSQVWQLPVLLLSVALFAAGLWVARPGDPTPQYAEALDQIQKLVTAGQYAEAVDELASLEPAVPTLPLMMQARFHALVGDAEFLLQQKEGWNLAENHQKILAAYRNAEKYGEELTGDRSRRLAETLAALGREDAALQLLGELGDTGRRERVELLKRMIRAALAAEPPRLTEADHLIATMQQDAALPPADHAWAIARHADVLMRRGETDSAIELLLRRIRLLTIDDPDAPIGELATRLGRAYLADGDAANAERWLLRARQVLDAGDPINADALLALGEIRFAEDNVIEALEHYAAVVERFEGTAAYREALVGKAECEARLGSFDRALHDYETAVKILSDDLPRDDPRMRRLRESLSTQQELRFGEGNYSAALRLLDLERQVHPQPLPAELLFKLARTHEQLARTALGLADGEPETRDAWAKSTEKQRARAAEHYAKAADFFLNHARAITIRDDDAYGESLWRAGDYYDKSGLYKRAIDVFSEYREGRPSDPRALAATYRLARSYQASGRFDEAIDLFKALIENNPKSPEAYQSLVPLATSFLASNPPRTGEAIQVLRSVVENHPALRPESNEYREALVTLGQLYYRRGGEGDYEDAVEALNEAVSRYGDDLRLPQLQFQLGDAYRKSVQQLDAKLAAGAMPPSQTMKMKAERARRLDEAQQHFDGVINALEKPGAGALDELEQLYLRNSYFYRADCAFDLGRYDGPDGAISLYEKALQKYDRDPAALVALVQIANCYAELGDEAKARVVNERAKVLLKRIPDEAFDDPNLPMNRYHWQRWLDWTSQLSAADTAP